jgi:hypothetical protein
MLNRHNCKQEGATSVMKPVQWAVRFPEPTTTSLSRHSLNGSPTVIEFAKAGAEHHFCPPSIPA